MNYIIRHKKNAFNIYFICMPCEMMIDLALLNYVLTKDYDNPRAHVLPVLYVCVCELSNDSDALCGLCLTVLAESVSDTAYECP